MKAFYPPGTEPVTKGVSDFVFGGNATFGDNVGGAGSVTVRASESSLRSLSPIQSYELCVAVQAAVRTISENLAKAKRRIFTSSGEEVLGGPAFDFINRPNPYSDGSKFIRDLVTWYNISGELAGYKSMSAGKLSVLPIAPPRLTYWNFKHYSERSEVGSWRYTWEDGQQEQILDSNLLFANTFNPNDPVRGLSPLVTGSVEVGTLHWSGRYNQSFFQNGAVPSHLVSLPEGTPRRERDDFARRYLAEYSAYSHNAHKVMVVAGGDIKVHPLEQPFQDGAFMELRKQMLQQVAMLYRVPAIEIGLYDKARFDTASEERKLFMESTLMPQADMLTAAIQQQIFDRYFLASQATTRPAKMSKALSDRFDSVRAESGGGLVFLIDTDTLPIANTIKVAQAEHAIKFRQAFGASLKETVDFFGIELEDRPEREDVYLLATERNVTHPEKNIEVMSAQMKADAAPKEAPKPKKPAKKALHKLRTLSVKGAVDGCVWSLAEADVGFPLFTAECRATLKPLIESKNIEGVKAWFDTIDLATLEN
jgi:HK97 family phage portal protein